jgi:2'-5' RNA ligase
MAVIRTFIGIALPAEVRHVIARYIDSLRSKFPGIRVGWEKEEKLHITIKFLGNKDESQLIDLKQALEDVAAQHGEFSVLISGTGVFPSLRRPGVLWLGVSEGRESVVSLAESVESACEAVGILHDKRPFSPHLTIGRIREPQKACQLAAAHIGSDFAPISFEVRRITFYLSRLHPSGSVYETISFHDLRR